MPAEGPNNSWPPAAIEFLKRNLPLERGVSGEFVEWDHRFMTAYQIGCEALAALGQADETDRGARPRSSPTLPGVLPRWDDIAVAVVWLAAQQNKLEYRRGDGSRAPRGEFVVVGLPPPPLPNIEPAHGLGAAWASSETLPALEALGLIESGHWAKAAETVQWRSMPAEWNLNVRSDARFASALARACDTVPFDLRAEMDQLAVISAEDVQAALDRRLAEHAALQAQQGRASQPLINSLERMRTSLEFLRANAFDWLFFSRWRLDDGWLTAEQADRTLEIFHDRLAIAMRQAVAGSLYPQATYLAERG